MSMRPRWTACCCLTSHDPSDPADAEGQPLLGAIEEPLADRAPSRDFHRPLGADLRLEHGLSAEEHFDLLPCELRVEVQRDRLARRLRPWADFASLLRGALPLLHLE